MPQPEITVSRAAHGSEEVAASVGDTIAELRAQLATADERLTTVLFRANADVERAQANAAAMEAERNQWHDGFLALQAAGQLQRMEAKHRADALRAELAAARAIVESVRPVRAWLPRLIALYAAYDAAVEEGNHGSY